MSTTAITFPTLYNIASNQNDYIELLHSALQQLDQDGALLAKVTDAESRDLFVHQAQTTAQLLDANEWLNLLAKSATTEERDINSWKERMREILSAHEKSIQKEIGHFAPKPGS